MPTATSSSLKSWQQHDIHKKTTLYTKKNIKKIKISILNRILIFEICLMCSFLLMIQLFFPFLIIVVSRPTYIHLDYSIEYLPDTYMPFDLFFLIFLLLLLSCKGTLLCIIRHNGLRKKPAWPGQQRMKGTTLILSWFCQLIGLRVEKNGRGDSNQAAA